MSEVGGWKLEVGGWLHKNCNEFTDFGNLTSNIQLPTSNTELPTPTKGDFLF